jgi:hypothetical protein
MKHHFAERYIRLFVSDGIPTIMLFSGFRWSFALGLTLLGTMDVTDSNGATASCLLGWYRPKYGFGVVIWPLVISFIGV